MNNPVIAIRKENTLSPYFPFCPGYLSALSPHREDNISS